jgi:hypothetical protein
MIRYTLRCEHDHAFDAWFASSAAYDRAAEAAANVCPLCGSVKVDKAIMAPAIGGAGRREEKVTLATVDPKRQALVAAVKELREKVAANADYVGGRFAEEARKIHYEETPPRSIYGEATPEEARSLAEEGVDFQPLPQLPEGQN